MKKVCTKPWRHVFWHPAGNSNCPKAEKVSKLSVVEANKVFGPTTRTTKTQVKTEGKKQGACTVSVTVRGDTVADLLISSKQGQRTSKVTGLKITSSVPSNYSEMDILYFYILPRSYNEL